MHNAKEKVITSTFVNIIINNMNCNAMDTTLSEARRKLK